MEAFPLQLPQTIVMLWFFLFISLQEIVEDLHPLYVSIFTHLLNWKTSTNVNTESHHDPEVVIEPLSHDTGVTLINVS